jgi:predicted transcriptional regulator
MADDQPLNLIELSAEIVGAYVSNNHLSNNELPDLITAVHTSLSSLNAGPTEASPAKSARPLGVRASIKAEHLISMIDGKPYKVLRRHLSAHGFTPEQYREKFDLPKDYPMVSSVYAETRRTLAKAIGLGHKPATVTAASKNVDDVVKRRRGRPSKISS